MIRTALLAALAVSASPLAAQPESSPATPDSVLAASSPEEWVPIPESELLVMDLAPDAAGNRRKVVIQLVPKPFSRPWVENIRTLAREGWWDGTAIYRAVDNWVVQWGAGEGDRATDKPLPEGLNEGTESDYAVATDDPALSAVLGERGSAVEDTLRRMRGEASAETNDGPLSRDPYADVTLFFEGWPIAASRREAEAWPVHCYGTVGVSRDNSPDTGTGAELYAVIGHAPRQLDRNLAVVGRVIAGAEHLATLPRGTGEYGMYERRSQDTPIRSVRLGSEWPGVDRYEYLASDSESFRQYMQVRANRKDAFYIQPAGGIDVCNVQVPIREVTADGSAEQP